MDTFIFNYGETCTPCRLPSYFSKGASVPFTHEAPQPWLRRLLPLSVSLTLLDFTWVGSGLVCPVSGWFHGAQCPRGPPWLCVRQAFCPSGCSEFWLERVSSNSLRPAVSALGTDPEVELLGHTAALVCCQGACVGCGAGSVEQAHCASAQMGRSPHLPPVQGPGRKISQPATASHHRDRHTGVSTVSQSTLI